LLDGLHRGVELAQSEEPEWRLHECDVICIVLLRAVLEAEGPDPAKELILALDLGMCGGIVDIVGKARKVVRYDVPVEVAGGLEVEGLMSALVIS
jgi:hypothetical protein